MLNKMFKFDENNTHLKKEVTAGITTFLSMAYILGLNPVMLFDAGMPPTGVFFATALSSGIACIMMGLVAKYPVGLAPGMGYNALFTYTVVLGMGNTWQTGLAAVFVSSVIFVVISASGLMEATLNIIPYDLKLGIGAGIGFYLAFIGLQGCGIIVDDPATLVAMGNLTAPHTLLAVIGIFLTLMLHIKKVPGAVFFGLIFNTFIGLIMVFCGFGAGDFLMPHIPEHIASVNFDTSLFFGFLEGFDGLFSNISNLIIVVFSFVFLSFFDTAGIFVSIGRECGFIDENGQIQRIRKAFVINALSGTIGSVLGTSTVTTYLESMAGIDVGGRTGLTAIVTGMLFLISIFFAPLVLSLFTSSVTVVALVTIGILMVIQLKEVDWNNLVTATSVAMTIIMMIFNNSISLGIAWGLLTYIVATIGRGKFREMHWAMWPLLVIFTLYIFYGL